MAEIRVFVLEQGYEKEKRIQVSGKPWKQRRGSIKQATKAVEFWRNMNGYNKADVRDWELII